MTKNIQLQLTEENARMIRDAIRHSIKSEADYRKDLKRLHNIEDIKNLLELSERQEDKFSRLEDLFHNALVSSMMDWVEQADEVDSIIDDLEFCSPTRYGH